MILLPRREDPHVTCLVVLIHLIGNVSGNVIELELVIGIVIVTVLDVVKKTMLGFQGEETMIVIAEQARIRPATKMTFLIPEKHLAELEEAVEKKAQVPDDERDVVVTKVSITLA